MMMPERDNKDHFTVNVLVEVSPTFFAWLTNFGDKIEITNPPTVIDQMKAFVNTIAETYK